MFNRALRRTGRIGAKSSGKTSGDMMWQTRKGVTLSHADLIRRGKKRVAYGSAGAGGATVLSAYSNRKSSGSRRF